jgi:hypothetical protein
MKKVFVLIFLIGLTSAVSAQLQFGVKAGYNSTDFSYSGPGVNTLAPRSDFNAGIFAFVPVRKHFFLQPELLYSGQGVGYTGTIPETNYNNYLNVPLLIKYQHNSGLFAESGPQIGFLLSAKSETTTGSFNSKDNIEPIDFSWAFGLGYKIPTINLGIDLRYNLGLTKIFKSPYYPGIAKNSVFQIDLFYQFKVN